MSQINPICATTFDSSAGLRRTFQQQNTKVNGILFDISFTPTAEYMSGDKFAILRDIFFDLNLRQGGAAGGVGGSDLLIDSISLYQILEYSDYIAGVSMSATPMTAGAKWRVSGYLPIGFFGLGARDSLDLEIYLDHVIPAGISVDLVVSTVFLRDQLSLIRRYTTAKPTGSDQSYTDVIGIYFDCDTETKKSITVRDEVNDNSVVAIEDAIAYSNSTGRFELFTRFGEVYSDVYGVGQNVTVKCPKIETAGGEEDKSAELLIVSYVYDTAFLKASAGAFDASSELLYTKIRDAGGEKAAYLSALGII